MAFKMKGFPQHKGVKPQDKKKVDPDAPGTPGKPGYEPPVKRSDLDAKGKAIWDKHRERKQPTYEGTDEYRKEKDIPKKEFEKRGVKKKGAPKKNDDVMIGPKGGEQYPAGQMTDEDPDTQGPVRPVSRTGPATDERKFAHNERINDLEDKIEFLNNDIEELMAADDQSREAANKVKEMRAKIKSYESKIKILDNA
jgi:hypothetical protein